MLGDLPKGWQEKRLRDLCESIDRRLGDMPKLEVLSVAKRGVVPQSQTYDKEIASDDISRYRVIRPGEFGLAPMALYYGAIGRYHGVQPGIISPAYNVFCHRADTDPDFLEALVRLPRMIARYEALSQGGNLEGKRKLTPFDAFETVKVVVPPLAEQRAIAGVLGAVEVAIAKAVAACAQLHEATEALAEVLFTSTELGTGGDGTTEWRASTLGSEMASIQVGIVVKPASYYVDTGGVPALRSLNVRPNRLNLGEMVQISEEGHRLNAKSALRAGDIVTVRTGEPGKTALVPDSIGELNCVDIIFSRPGTKVRGEYISFFMNSRVAKRQIAVLQGGLAQQHLNVGEMKRIKIAVPSIDYQDRTIRLLNEAWKRIEAEDASLANLRSLRDALAEELLSGRLRLPEGMIARHADAPDKAA